VAAALMAGAPHTPPMPPAARHATAGLLQALFKP
jgi:hypothetical protein